MTTSASTWQFAEDLIVDRALLETLVTLLVREGVLNKEQFMRLFEEKLKERAEEAGTEEKRKHAAAIP